MRILDQFLDTWFKRSKDGHRLFFPWGVLGRGYFVPLAEDEERIRTHGKVLVIGCGAVAVLIFLFRQDLLVAGSLFAFLLIATFAVPLYLKRGLEPSTERLSFKENFKASSSILPKWFVWLGLIICCFFAITSLAVLILRPHLWLETGGGIVLFGLLAALYLRMLIVRRA